MRYVVLPPGLAGSVRWIVYPAFLSPLRAARTECGCQPIADCRAARSAPALRLKCLRKIAAFVSRAGVVLDLGMCAPRVCRASGVLALVPRCARGAGPGMEQVTLVSARKSRSECH